MTQDTGHTHTHTHSHSLACSHLHTQVTHGRLLQIIHSLLLLLYGRPPSPPVGTLLLISLHDPPYQRLPVKTCLQLLPQRHHSNHQHKVNRVYMCIHLYMKFTTLYTCLLHVHIVYMCVYTHLLFLLPPPSLPPSLPLFNCISLFISLSPSLPSFLPPPSPHSLPLSPHSQWLICSS